MNHQLHKFSLAKASKNDAENLLQKLCKHKKPKKHWKRHWPPLSLTRFWCRWWEFTKRRSDLVRQFSNYFNFMVSTKEARQIHITLSFQTFLIGGLHADSHRVSVFFSTSQWLDSDAISFANLLKSNVSFGTIAFDGTIGIIHLYIPPAACNHFKILVFFIRRE